MVLLDNPLESRFRAIEDRLGAIEVRLIAVERELAVLKARLDAMPTSWFLLGLILPLYGLVVLGFGGLFWNSLHR